MREIKFRAWKTDEGKMYHGGFSVGADGALYGQSWSHLTDKLMQFTGLHDKNGREVFEDDIVIWGIHRCKIEYRDDGFSAISNEGGHNFGVAALLGLGAEVIGNVFETPELLTTPASSRSERGGDGG